MKVVIKIPLPDTSEFELHAIYSIPMRLRADWDGFVKLPTKCLAYSRGSDRLVRLSGNDVAECTAIGDIEGSDTRLCRNPNEEWVGNKLSCECVSSPRKRHGSMSILGYTPRPTLVDSDPWWGEDAFSG